MYGFPSYPRGNTDITNLDYILNELKSQGEKIESWIQFSQIKFADPIDWDINTTYKAYTIVLAPDFNSYISKRDVSGHAYIDYTNTDFWYKIGNYNAQMEAIDKKIDKGLQRVDSSISSLTSQSGRLNEDVATLARVVKNRRRIIAIGDSYGADNGSYWTGWVNCLKNIDRYDEVYGAGVGGAGFVNKTEGSNFLDILKSVNTGVANNSITDIIVMGGYNDASVSANRNAIYNAMKEFVSYANNKYPNAKLHLGFIAFNRFDSATQMRLDTYMGIYQQYGILAGFTFYRNLYFVLKKTSFVFNVSGNPNSGFHPNTDGNNEVALQALNCIRNGECHVHYGAVELGMNIYMDDGIYSFETTGQASWGSQYMNTVAMPFNTPVECVDAKTLELVWAMQTATPFYINALLVDNSLKILTNVRVAFANGKISYTNVGNTETVTPNSTMQFWFNKTNGVSWQTMF